MSLSRNHISKWIWLYILLFNSIMILISMSMGGGNVYYNDSTIYQKAFVFTYGIGFIALILLGVLDSVKNGRIVLYREKKN